MIGHRKMFHLTLLLFTVILLTMGCKTSLAENPQELRFLLLEEPTELDPTTGNESYATPIMYHAFEPLLREDINGALTPGLAERWEALDENTRFVFYLRKDAKWSDNLPITASQVRDTYLYILGPESTSKNIGILMPYIENAKAYNQGELSEDQVGIRVLDDYTLEIKTSGPTPYFLNLMSFINFSPVRVDHIKANGPDWDKFPDTYISNGPYKLSQYEAGIMAVLEKNPYYWNQDQIAIDKITFYFKKADQDPIQLYLDGMIDGIYELDPNALRTYPELESAVHTHIAPSTSFMVINHKHPLLQDSRLRKALNQTIPREAIVTDVISGAGIATNYLVPINYHLAGEPFHDFTALVKPLDTQSAKSTIDSLKQEGFDFEKPFEILAMDTGPDVAVANAIAAQWEAELGIKANVKSMPWGELFENALAGTYDLIMIGFGGDYPHPMTFLSNFTEEGILTLILGWHNPDIDIAIEEALKLSDEAEALKAFRAIEDQLLSTDPIFNLYYRKKITLMSPKVTNWYRNSSSQFVFTQASIKAE